MTPHEAHYPFATDGVRHGSGDGFPGMTTPLRRVILALFLGLPGMILWLGGFASFILATVFSFNGFWPDGLVSMALSAAAASLGFIMFTCAKLMTREEASDIPARHLPAMIAFQLAVMISGAVAIASTLVTSAMLISRSGHPGAPWTAVASVSLCAALLHFHPALTAKWQPQTGEEKLLDDHPPDSTGPSSPPPP